ncbi:DEAD-domain-containing protein [Moesziomyces antarcticus]|uniref:ATP-dependent RNA helicase n=2 Tax=Pseudozyma antarctica TaxID=84753 RepID=A0A081CMA4_PSEA2|nr:DEAD-domain-containing protein [Moesziomyces antarcticus]GAK67800.1 DEAD-domain-containing protein [Moesziomyces antarcticus]SPO48957.1 related to MSS116 - RNA helicase of the DEAD box family, mitochondrial [Moesziomyces antarcticus]
MDSNSLANRLGPQAGGQGASGRGGGRGGRGGRGRGGARGRGGKGRGRGGSAATQQNVDHTNTANTDTVATPDDTPLPSGAATPTWTPKSIAPGTDAAVYLTDNKFADLKGQIDNRLLSAIPFPTMSAVQAATLSTALSGRDVLAQAKTGTGKTLAFLIPSIHKLCALPTPPPQSSISVLVLSPTRELALQIEKEAHMLLANLQGTFGVQHVVGGTNIGAERKRLQRDRKDLLIATPGRLLDHLSSDAPGLDLRKACQNLKVLVLDEADRMLDMGFRNELEKILKMLPDPVASQRQSLFFSATIPSFVHDVAKLRPDHAFISTLTEQDTNTHEHVPQESYVCSLRECLPRALQVVLAEAVRYPANHKILVFLPTARSTSLAAAVFSQLRGLAGSPYAKLGQVFEIHSRKSQAVRTKTMETFQSSASGILFSSDVTARGIDIPGISLVLQLGLPSNLEQYIHRLGRTARAGKEGRGVLILADFERFFLGQNDVKRLPITQLNVAAVEAESGVALGEVAQHVDRVMQGIDATTRSQAYQAHLGFYKGYLKQLRWKPEELIDATNDYAKDILQWPAQHDGSWVGPPLLQKTVSLMGLKGKRGLHIVKELPGKPNGAGQKRQGGGQGGSRPNKR